MIERNLRMLFPELESIPHADTLFRLLSRIDGGEIEKAQIDLVNQLIRKKKFMPFRVNNGYPIAIDGTQKLGGLELWSEGQLHIASRRRRPTHNRPTRSPSTTDTPSMCWRRS
jgi:hypothetical protein